MSKCTTTAAIEMIRAIDSLSFKNLKVKPAANVKLTKFSIELDKNLADKILKNAGKLNLKKKDDLAVVLDNLIHYFADGEITLK
jgi:hypothetical protein